MGVDGRCIFYNLVPDFKMMDNTTLMPLEHHPWQPYLPVNARVLMLGSFPPKPERWCIDFFYPNWINDMWRIMGLVFYGDKDYFTLLPAQKGFDRDRIEAFLQEKGIALYDMATVVRRLKDNASDKFLDVVETTDWQSLLRRLPQCMAVVATGQKATDLFTASAMIVEPRIGDFTAFDFEGRPMHFYRMPSSSRAYPLALTKKAEVYTSLFEREHLL